MNPNSLRWLTGAAVGLSVLAVLNAVTTGHDVSAAPGVLATFVLGAVFFFGGAFLIGRLRPGRVTVAAIVAALLPTVLLSAVVSGLLPASQAVPTIGISLLLFVLTFGVVFAILDPNRGSSR